MTTPTRATVLHVQHLSFTPADQPALIADWSTAIAPGVTLLHGDTGSGKSTLLRLIAGDQPASAGRLMLAGTALADDPAAYRRQVFWCDPATDAFDRVTARECSMLLSAGDPGFDATAWEAMVDRFALAPHIDKPMYMLSTGSKRKVWLAAALASGRPLTLLDEPTGGLDARSIAGLMEALTRLATHASRAVIVASSERLARVPLAGLIELPLH
ncbi:MAG: ATP-binding cassette domain-containing protein [Burkholderiales bacterium]